MSTSNKSNSKKAVFRSFRGKINLDILELLEKSSSLNEVSATFPEADHEILDKYLNYVQAVLANERIREMELDLAC